MMGRAVSHHGLKWINTRRKELTKLKHQTFGGKSTHRHKTMIMMCSLVHLGGILMRCNLMPCDAGQWSLMARYAPLCPAMARDAPWCPTMHHHHFVITLLSFHHNKTIMIKVITYLNSKASQLIITWGYNPYTEVLFCDRRTAYLGSFTEAYLLRSELQI